MTQVQKRARRFPNLSAANALKTFVIMVMACIICAPLQLIGGSDFHVPLIFVLAVLVISRYTDGYFYGIIASFASLFCVNYVFTYPYFELNFTITGYPLTFLSMLSVSIITSTMTSQIKKQEKIRIEAEKEKMRANLLRAISHDLRTPLTSIVGSLSAVLESGDSIPPEKRDELLGEAREEAQWLIRMVENLLSITRIDDSYAKIEKRPEAIEEIISESVVKFKRQFPDMKVSVSVPEELIIIPIDAMLIEQVIINLLFNSAIHGVSTTEITIEVVNDGEFARFSIKDNGKGFSDDELSGDRVGYRAGQEKSNAVDGRRSMGIGLSVCTSIIDAHGGALIAGNYEGGGAEIDFTIPLKEE